MNLDQRLSDVLGQIGADVKALQQNAAPQLLTLPAQATTPAAQAGNVVVFGRGSAGRVMAAQVDAGGLTARLQPLLSEGRLSMWMPNGAGATTATSFGGLWTAGGLVAVPLADTAIGRIRKAQQNTTTTAGSGNGINSEVAYSRNSGFHLIGHFCPFAAGTVASRRFFAGMGAAAPTNVALTGYAGIGVDADAGQNNLQVRGVNGAATDLGADFPANSATVWYRLELFCRPLGVDVGWRLENLLTGISATGTFTGAQVPAAATFFAAQCRIITTAAAAQSMQVGLWSVETRL